MRTRLQGVQKRNQKEADDNISPKMGCATQEGLASVYWTCVQWPQWKWVQRWCLYLALPAEKNLFVSTKRWVRMKLSVSNWMGAGRHSKLRVKRKLPAHLPYFHWPKVSEERRKDKIQTANRCTLCGLTHCYESQLLSKTKTKSKTKLLLPQPTTAKTLSILWSQGATKCFPDHAPNVMVWKSLKEGPRIIWYTHQRMFILQKQPACGDLIILYNDDQR